MDLLKKKCIPCEGGVPKLEPAQILEFVRQTPSWNVKDDKLRKTFQFEDFVTAMKFLNRVADLAENEGHHPDFSVQYGRVDFAISTHDAKGLTENDFILAAKIDQLA
jgi:4a-hydroxytetrahydrobiopterin dehydratase